MTDSTPQQTSMTPTDILDDLGLLPPPDDDQADDAVRADERREHPRVPTAGRVRIVVLAGGTPLGDPFDVAGLDISRGGVRLSGTAPLLKGCRLAIELKRSDGTSGVLGGTVMHSTFGDPMAMTNDNASVAGVAFSTLEAGIVAEHFARADGRVSLSATQPA